jgi:hypothetical protein
MMLATERGDVQRKFFCPGKWWATGVENERICGQMQTAAARDFAEH